MTRYEFGLNKPVQAFGMFEDRDLVELLHEIAKECRAKKRNKRLFARVATVMDRAGFEITKMRQETNRALPISEGARRVMRDMGDVNS